MKKKKHAWASGKPAAENARRVLPGLVEAFFLTGRKATAEHHPAKALHRFRLEVKRLRYFLELFLPCYGPGLKERLAVLKQVQDYLGDLSDCSATQAMLEGAAAYPPREKKQLSAFLAKQGEEKRAAFVLYWQQTCDTPGRLEWWTNYLEHFAGERRKKRRKPARKTAKRVSKTAKPEVAPPPPSAAADSVEN